MLFASYSSKLLTTMIQSDNPRVRSKALQYLYSQFFPSIKNFVMKNSGTKEEAEDLFQESISVLYMNVMELKFMGQSDVKTYLYGIAKNIWLKKLKKRLPEPPEKVLTTSDMSTERAFSAEGKLKMEEALQQLPSDCRRVLKDFYFHDRTMLDIMEQFGLGSEQAAKNKKRRCLKRLIELFDQLDLTKDQFYDD